MVGDCVVGGNTNYPRMMLLLLRKERTKRTHAFTRIKGEGRVNKTRDPKPRSYVIPGEDCRGRRKTSCIERERGGGVGSGKSCTKKEERFVGGGMFKSNMERNKKF